MTAVDKPRKKRIFIASSQADVAEVQKAMRQFDLDAVTLDQTAAPGTTCGRQFAPLLRLMTQTW